MFWTTIWASPSNCICRIMNKIEEALARHAPADTSSYHVLDMFYKVDACSNFPSVRRMMQRWIRIRIITQGTQLRGTGPATDPKQANLNHDDFAQPGSSVANDCSIQPWRFRQVYLDDKIQSSVHSGHTDGIWTNMYEVQRTCRASHNVSLEDRTNQTLYPHMSTTNHRREDFQFGINQMHIWKLDANRIW